VIHHNTTLPTCTQTCSMYSDTYPGTDIY